MYDNKLLELQNRIICKLRILFIIDMNFGYEYITYNITKS